MISRNAVFARRSARLVSALVRSSNGSKVLVLNNLCSSLNGGMRVSEWVNGWEGVVKQKGKSCWEYTDRAGPKTIDGGRGGWCKKQREVPRSRKKLSGGDAEEA